MLSLKKKHYKKKSIQTKHSHKACKQKSIQTKYSHKTYKESYKLGWMGKKYYNNGGNRQDSRRCESYFWDKN